MMDRTIGRTISHYTILDRLGAGGMGVVYKALDSNLDRLVAVKFLPPHRGQDETARARFTSEAKAASALDHPNIATIFEIDESADVGLFIVMAYYPGESLAERIRRGPLPLPVALDFAVQIGEGLAAAHEHKIVHRDIKPGNLMVTDDGIVKILDFGLAKPQSKGVDDSGALLGTLKYMSPERFGYGPVDHRCDIWALGVVLYNMITARLPFDCPDAMELMYRIKDSEPEPFSAPPELRAIILRALAKQPATRHQSMRDLVAEVRALQLRLPSLPEFRTPEQTWSAEASVQPTTTATLPFATVTSGERRQLTVLSCELGDWAKFVEQLDSEQLGDVLLDYHSLCESAIQPFDGRVAQALDANLTILFGLPAAHEDDALRAVSAGLAIASRVRELNAEHRKAIPALRRAPLYARLGAHTGEVVAGDEGNPSRHATVIGVAGTLANEARGMAAPGELVITQDTYRLVRGFFTVQPLGPKQLPGSLKPVDLYQVVSRTAAADRIAAGAPFGLTEFVGRSEELSSLLEQWDTMKESGARVVLLSGEAGVGKSRLVEALKSQLATMPHRLLEGRCSPYHQNSPFFPILDLLGRIFQLDEIASADAKGERLRIGLARYGLTSRQLHALTSLFSPPAIQDAHPRAVSPGQREDTLQAVVRLFLSLSSERPLLFVVEDLHWADPTTLDALTKIVNQGLTARILTILTFRPEFVSPWDQRADVNQFMLGSLSHRESMTLIDHLTRGKRLPVEILKQIIGNSDGIPLFIEELTKAVLESDFLQETQDGYELTKHVSSLAVPATLRDSLTARLDRLGGAKEVAQLASVLGRTFSYEWLESISPLAKHVLRRHLARLVEAELLYQQGTPPSVTYTFKHALIKDAAYLSLLTRVRQQCHERIARALERHFPDVKSTQPELLAHHYADAGRVEKAVGYWRSAGRQAVARSANVEAAAHFRKALDLLGSLPETARRRQRQLELVIALGGAQVATMGYAAVAVGEAFRRARELCARVGETPQLFDALQGLYSFHLVRAELQTSLELSGRLIELAARLDDQPRGLEATLRRGISLYTIGDLGSAYAHLERVSASSDPDEPRETTLRFGQDRVVASLSHLSVVSWLVGHPDRAVTLGQQALARARELSHPFSMAFALLYAAIIRSFRNEPAGVEEHTAALAALCQEQGFVYRLAQSHILDGWARATRDRDEAAIPAIQLGIEKTRATGAQVLLPYYMALLADACLVVRQIPQGLTVVRDALGVVQRTDECFFQAELERLYGELLVISGADRAEAYAWFSKAFATARRQGARSFELRAATSLVRLAPDGPVDRRQVEDVVQTFGEGFDTPDMRAARELLQQLA
jgi:class 3 adenylate cyclase/predicted ATPase